MWNGSKGGCSIPLAKVCIPYFIVLYICTQLLYYTSLEPLLENQMIPIPLWTFLCPLQRMFFLAWAISFLSIYIFLLWKSYQQCCFGWSPYYAVRGSFGHLLTILSMVLAHLEHYLYHWETGRLYLFTYANHAGLSISLYAYLFVRLLLSPNTM
jgi:hypothetical protein